MKRFLTKTCLQFIAFCLMLMTACDDTNVPDGAFEPHSKKLEGSYQIVSATRNGADITDRFDFSTFRLTFQTSSEGTGSYTIENEAPFVIEKNGTWTFDDPSYPVAIAFTQTGGTSLRVAEIVTPIIYDKPQLIFKFSPGCSGNTYQYTLNYVTQ